MFSPASAHSLYYSQHLVLNSNGVSLRVSNDTEQGDNALVIGSKAVEGSKRFQISRGRDLN